MSVTWRYLSGDTASFAVELALITDDASDVMVDADERASWGSFALWANDVNPCEHTVAGETLRAAHWYLLPLAEWLAANWDALLHEERLPVPEAGTDAARGFARAAVLAELDAATGRGDAAAKAVQDWYGRHGLRAAAPGALLPDVYLRRYGDHIEFSAMAEPPAGADWGVVFTPPAVARIAVTEVAAALRDTLATLATVLRRRYPTSERYRALDAAVAELANPGREATRLAWLSGAGQHHEAFHTLWQRAQTAIESSLRPALKRFTSAPGVAGELALLAPPATLLFGSLAPDVSADDVAALYTSLLADRGDSRTGYRLRELGDELLSAWPAAGLSPGEQGSLYGEEAWRQLAGDRSPEVDVEKLLTEFGIMVDHTTLRDRSVRAVSMVGDDGSARIVVNQSFRLGTTTPVERFSLAHELAHLLLDQDRAARLVVVSGPWAPVEIEQRANAFAAAFLIPSPLLDAVWTQTGETLTAEDVRVMARGFAVSQSALINRLQNLGRIAATDAEALRPAVPKGRAD